MPVTALFGIPLFESGAAMLAFETRFQHPHDGLVSILLGPFEELGVGDARVLETEVEL